MSHLHSCPQLQERIAQVHCPLALDSFCVAASPCVAQTGRKLRMLLPHHFACWDYILSLGTAPRAASNFNSTLFTFRVIFSISFLLLISFNYCILASVATGFFGKIAIREHRVDQRLLSICWQITTFSLGFASIMDVYVFYWCYALV